MRAICVHGHFYQPPREHPWLGVVGPEASAAPDRDWNARITRECYAPCASARLLDAGGRLADLVNVYEWTSFDFGPTLLNWLAPSMPELMGSLRAADTAGRLRTGYGNAWAQPYAHAILPLSRPHDVRTQVLWGKRDFEHRFGRSPEGMWLPEMAVDVAALEGLAEAGITLTMLAPHQARRVRPLGGDDDAWQDVTAETLDTRRLYRVRLPRGLGIDVLFRDATLSAGLAFGALLGDGAALAARLKEAVAGASGPAILGIAVDGETFGHHHRFGEMALAFALRTLAQDPDVALVGPAAFRAEHPVTDEVEIVEDTSWSCAHGVERWRGDCGCRTGGPADWTQAWRTPLRQAIDWLRDETSILYHTRAAEVLRDTRGARDRYIECVLDPGRVAKFLAAEAQGRLSPAAAVHARRCLELVRHTLLMQTSCAWFFDDLAGLEPLLALRHAARAIELSGALGRRLEDGFVARLEAARSNLPAGGTGADVYRRAAGAAATPPRVAATAALLRLLEEPARVPGYEVVLTADRDEGRLAGEARVTELSTGAAATVPFVAEGSAAAAPRCRVGEVAFDITHLFAVQRERLLDGVGRRAALRARAGRREAIATIRAVVAPLLAGDTPLPAHLALLLGYEEAEAIANALVERTAPIASLAPRAEALRRRGLIFPARWLAGEVAGVLEERLGALPEGASDALALLDLAVGAGLRLDLTHAQVRALRWWNAAPPERRTDPILMRLWQRLDVAPAAP
ncbi:MAG: DUF3536 domain-containing protein [Candidatus Binatia bacterium]